MAEKVPGLNKVTGRSEDRQAAEVAGAVAEAIAGPVFDTLNTLSESDYSTDEVVCFWNSWKVSTIVLRFEQQKFNQFLLGSGSGALDTHADTCEHADIIYPDEGLAY